MVGGLRAFKRWPLGVLGASLLFLGGFAAGWLLRPDLRESLPNGNGASASDCAAGQAGRSPHSREPRSEGGAGANGNAAPVERRAHLLLEQGQFGAAVQLLQQRFLTYTPTVAQLLLLAEGQAGSSDYQGEVDTLFQARLLAQTGAAENVIDSRLKRAVDAVGRALIGANRWGDLDLFYEELISREPENGGYYLQLGRLRVRMGRLQEARDPLLRIQHDPVYGEEATALLEQVKQMENSIALVHESLPMEVRGQQFAIRAMLDDRREVKMLIDTGAAITVVRPHVLRVLGYDLDAGDQQYFATANGVARAPMVILAMLAIGNARIEQLDVAGIELAGSDDIDGLLGMNFLGRYHFQIDQSGRVLRLGPATD